MIKIYRTFDPSGKPRKLIGKVKTKAEAKAFQTGYIKGIFDKAVQDRMAK